MSQSVILAFMRKPNTEHFLYNKFCKLPFRKLIRIHNVDDKNYVIKRIFSKHRWINIESLFILACFLIGFSFYHQAWLAALFIGLFLIASNLAFIALEKMTKANDPFVKRYKNLVMKGETLFLVECEPSNFEKFIKAIQKVQDEPVAFFSFEDGTIEKISSAKEMLPHPLETNNELVKQARGLSTKNVVVSYKKNLSREFLDLVKQLSEKYQATYKQLNNFASYNENIQLSAEWLLENSYTVKQSINDIQKNLPANYFQELPFITAGPYSGAPTLYPLVSRLIAASDGSITEENITLFLNAYQEKKPLTIGELWAFPLILKIRLVECLVDLTAKVLVRVKENQLADFWANRILNASRIDPENLYNVLSILSKEIPQPTTYFADQLMIQLTDTEAANTVLLGWLQKKVGENLRDIIQIEQGKQTLEQTSIANVISSLRRLEQMNWREVFENVSIVEKILVKDPAHKYADMDFPTKDFYRHTVEELAKLKKIPEQTIAETAIALAEAETTPLKQHVGYYLIDDGKPTLENSINYHPSFWQRLIASSKNHITGIYLSSCALLALLIAILFIRTDNVDLFSWPMIGLMLLSLIPISEIAIQLVNYFTAHMVSPNILPKMLYDKGVPESYRTLVVIPTLLHSEQFIRHELEKLEIHYLANTDPQIAFGIVTDFLDSPEETQNEDSMLLKIAKDGVQYLSDKYPSANFYLFHRNRKFNDFENWWMGWERKRGKLENLNSFLNGNTDPELDNFLHEGDPAFLAKVNYVLTADSDTQLPKDSIQRLIGALSHPLNIGYIDDQTKTLTRGYTIIQPRVSTNYISANSTWFAKLFSDPSGIDPYTKSTSDVYQDLFNEGVYHGKGLYDYKLFHHILSETLPENKVLSHDLLEGSYVRTAFASDIEFYDSFPETYASYAKRQHRWVRGDWQLLSWLKGTVRDAKKNSVSNPLSGINRWKIFDNLRRSLLPIATLATMILSWFTPLYMPWTILMLIVLSLPILLRIVDLSWISAKTKLISVGNEFYQGVIKTLVTFVFLPHQAWINANAICKALYRQYISKKHLLQWSTSSTIDKNESKSCYLQLTTISIVMLAAIVFLFYVPQVGLALKIPILALWLLSPIVCALLDKPYLKDNDSTITPLSERYLRLIARKTWRYFDDFVTEESHFLPPDNYQEKLKIEVAYRTSPTNIGLYMMSAISAQKFGYMTAETLLRRLNETVTSLKSLERYEGHFLNWYDIKNFSSLLPKYVSTVDSGNLLASFWATEENCKALLTAPILDKRSIVNGINDNLHLLTLSLKNENYSPSFNLNSLYSLTKFEDKSPIGLKITLENIQSETNRIITITERNEDFSKEAFYWLKQLQGLVNEILHTFNILMPWIHLFHQAEAAHITLLHPDALHWKEEATSTFPSINDLITRDVAGLIPFIGWIQSLPAGKLDEECALWVKEFSTQLNESFAYAEQLKETIHQLIDELQEISLGMNMSFLYNKERKLFTIGYNVTDQRIDSSCYDLLASEARLSSFIAIAKGDVPLEHWWSLGRPTTEAFGMTVVQSWGGTMFEYLMPVIWCRNYNNTLLDYACKAAVKCQIAYGNQLGIPWGISESAYSRLDIHNIYQYRAFGVPYLGLKSGLENDFVVTPYSSALALMIDAPASLKNMKRLDQQDMMGPYGFFESVDYSREYKPQGKQGIVIHTYMAHHQGMSISSFCNTLYKGFIQELFHAHPRVKALESILYERPDISHSKATGRAKEQPFPKLSSSIASAGNSRFETTLTPIPVTHLLSNGNYSLMVTNSGSGYSKYQDYDITRWRVDATCDNSGTCFFIRDVERNTYFSAASYPTASLGTSYAVNFSNHKVEINKKELGVEAKTEIVVSPEDNVEIRCMTLTNQAMRYRQIEVTSYVEIALAKHKADLMHPAFSKMFIETEGIKECEGLLAHRRKRAPEDPELWCFHIAAMDSGGLNPFSYETRRDLFIGKNRTLANPEKITTPLSNSQGYVLDPIFSLRKKVLIEGGTQVKISFITGFAHSREEALRLLDKYKNINASTRVMDMAWTHAELDLRRLHITHDDAHLFQRLANFMIYPDVQLRAPAEILKANRLGQNGLWGHGISGDNPILVVSIEDIHNIEVVHSALLAHAFWKIRGLKTDVVILNKEATGYDKPLNEHLVRVAQSYAQYTGININGGIFLIEADKLSQEDLNLIYTVAHAVLNAEKGSLSQQLATPRRVATIPSLLTPNNQIAEQPSPSLPFLELLYFNGIGGFTQDGKEYAIFYEHDKTNWAPWINVICNKNFGFLASSKGLGMTWNGNSQMNRLSPWSNDSTLNPISDLCYIRDEETGKFWTVTASPILENDPFRTKHGNGYTVYEHNSHAIEQEITSFVPLDDSHTPVRIQILRLTNRSSRNRKLSIYHYIELTLAPEREESQRYIETTWNYETNCLMATNYYRQAFTDQVAFLSCSPAPASYTGNRKDFIGRNQSTKSPDALKRTRLSQRTGIAMDPCFALQSTVDLYPNETTEIIVVFGESAHPTKIKDICSYYKNEANVHTALENVKSWWDKLHATLQVTTPEKSLDLLFNRWLTYQNLSCRMWARSAFYQSGGAYGFRDQLQDAAALVYLLPSITRDQIIKASGRQFLEGDVQHWWHVETGSGVRTKISDDLLWLPYVVMHYIQVTGDESIMDVEVPYIEGRLLNEGEHEAIVIPTQSAINGTVKEHCQKAIEKGLSLGPHGLPLIGGGDWNDGMNLVGVNHRGESVWLAWFIIYILKEFSSWLTSKQDHETAQDYQVKAKELLDAIEENAWDGEWYLRAFFDDGTPIGSHLSTEDKIDSLPQTWAVINEQNNDRVQMAMESVERYLIDEVNKLVLLFTPPFDKTEESPGYIKGYPPGVRENGGQYTHAAMWVAMALAKKGEGDKAMHVLQMINPINRTRNADELYKYRVEPYVLAADIYALPGQEGRGGWTWYTGSASLMYRTILEDVFGFKLRGDFLEIFPCIPKDWDGFSLIYWHGESCYEITIENPAHVSRGVVRVELDQQELPDHKVPLNRDAGHHVVKVTMG